MQVLSKLNGANCYLYQAIIFGILIVELILLGIVAAITLLCFHSHASRSMFVGIICVVCGIIMYASPLSVIVSFYVSLCHDYELFLGRSKLTNSSIGTSYKVTRCRVHAILGLPCWFFKRDRLVHLCFPQVFRPLHRGELML